MPQPLYHGTILYPQRSAYAIAITPLVQLKRLFQALYAMVLKLMWRELLTGQTPTDETGNGLAILLFGLLCWLSYVFRAVTQGALIAFFIFWFVDNLIAQQGLRTGRYIQQVSLEQTSTGELRWQGQRPGRSPLIAEFKPEQVQSIWVQRREIRGGAFQDRLANVWQAQLLLFDGSAWIVEEDSNLETVRAAIAIVRPVLGEVPVKFEHSYGNGDLAFTPLDWEELMGLGALRQSVGRHYSPRKCHVFSRWQWRHGWRLIKHIVAESGFLLFVMVIAGMMTQIGSILEQVRQGFMGSSDYIEISRVFGLAWPWQDWRLGCALLLAIAVMVYRGWQLSRVKHCLLDRHFLRASLDNRPLGKLPIHSIEAVLAIDAQPATVLILAQDGSVTLPAFPDLTDAQLYADYLNQAIAQFAECNGSDPPPSATD